MVKHKGNENIVTRVVERAAEIVSDAGEPHRNWVLPYSGQSL